MLSPDFSIQEKGHLDEFAIKTIQTQIFQKKPSENRWSAVDRFQYGCVQLQSYIVQFTYLRLTTVSTPPGWRQEGMTDSVGATEGPILECLG